MPWVTASTAFVIGSRRERLRRFDLSEWQIAKLHGPIGIYIGSKTPYEIAISILAELTAVKNAVHLPAQASIAEGKRLLDQAFAQSACIPYH